jgi:hypothetical protein
MLLRNKSPENKTGGHSSNRSSMKHLELEVGQKLSTFASHQLLIQTPWCSHNLADNTYVLGEWVYCIPLG